ncbi:hypothetical protein [Solicola sp. PLA-1-18]|uniref:hypothetical protein n=1 Tax=Solicola sp. PLA-1-18 TaxID=3380532 RepID=UPI003B7861FC
MTTDRFWTRLRTLLPDADLVVVPAPAPPAVLADDDRRLRAERDAQRVLVGSWRAASIDLPAPPAYRWRWSAVVDPADAQVVATASVPLPPGGDEGRADEVRRALDAAGWAVSSRRHPASVRAVAPPGHHAAGHALHAFAHEASASWFVVVTGPAVPVGAEAVATLSSRGYQDPPWDEVP